MNLLLFFLTPQLKSGHSFLLARISMSLCMCRGFQTESPSWNPSCIDGILRKSPRGRETLAPLGHTQNSIPSHCDMHFETNQSLENLSLIKYHDAIYHWPNPPMQLVWIRKSKKEKGWHYQLRPLRKVDSQRDSLDDGAPGRRAIAVVQGIQAATVTTPKPGFGMSVGRGIDRVGHFESISAICWDIRENRE